MQLSPEKTTYQWHFSCLNNIQYYFHLPGPLLPNLNTMNISKLIKQMQRKLWPYRRSTSTKPHNSPWNLCPIKLHFKFSFQMLYHDNTCRAESGLPVHELCSLFIILGTLTFVYLEAKGHFSLELVWNVWAAWPNGHYVAVHVSIVTLFAVIMLKGHVS